MSGNAAIVFKPATLEAVNLIIGLAGGTGSGKTFSAMRMAAGMSRGKRFAVVDTERGRAKHYAKYFSFDTCDLSPPFRPQAYAQAILAADNAGYPVIVVDSASHEWAGEGGILDWQEEELDRMAGDDWKKREGCKMAAWIKPKMDHKKMVQRLLQVRAHLILCFRAEEKIDMVRGDDGKMKIVPKVSRTGLDGWIPICEKSLPYELTASFLLTNDAPGMPKPIKLQEQHRALFPLDQPLDEKSGERIAAWAAGDAVGPPTIADYDNCTDRAAFDALEKRRADAWKTMPPSDTKNALKKAADAAKSRLATGAAAAPANVQADLVGDRRQPYTDESAIAALRACADDAARAAVWKDVQRDFEAAGREVPLEVESVNQEMKESFAL
jgi:hypothetical protein